MQAGAKPERPCRGSFSAMAICLTTIARKVQDFDMVMGLLVMPMFLFSGIFVPVSQFPDAVQWLMQGTPLYHAVSMLALPIIYSAYIGVADSARQKALEIARKKPVDEALFQSVGEMETAFACAEIASADMIRIAESERPGPSTTSRVMMRRTMVAKNAIGAVERAMEVVGGGSFYRDLGLERAFRDVQADRFHPLQEKPQLRYSGRLALGLDIDG